MGRLFEAVHFELGDWQDAAMQKAIAEHRSYHEYSARQLIAVSSPLLRQY